MLSKRAPLRAPPSAKTRPSDSSPSSRTSKTRMTLSLVSETYSLCSSGESTSPLGAAKQSAARCTSPVVGSTR